MLYFKELQQEANLWFVSVLHTDCIMQWYGQTAKLGVFTNYFLSLSRLEWSELCWIKQKTPGCASDSAHGKSPSCLHMSEIVQLCTSEKFELLFQDATKIFSLTRLCHQHLLHNQTTSDISCILPQNTQGKQETYFICIFTSMNWNREKPNLLYTVKTDMQSPCSKPSPEPGKVPKPDSCIQVAGSYQQASAERRTCLVSGWFPGCQIAAVLWPSRTKHRQGKAWTAWPWVSSTLIWGSPATLWRAWDLGKPCALEGNSKITCVHWKSRDCIFFFNYFLKVLSNCTSSVSSCSIHFWKMFYKTDIL